MLGGLDFTAAVGRLRSLAGSLGASLIGFIQAGTGAVALTLQALLRSFCVTPQQFGAVGDGVTDDSAAFVLAFATLRPVFVPPGLTYLLNNGGTAFQVKNALFGIDKTTTILKLASGTAAGGNFLTLFSNSSLRGLTVDVNNVASKIPVLLNNGATNITVEDNILNQADGAAVNAGSCIKGTSITKSKILGNTCSNANALAVGKATSHTIYLITCTDVEVAGNIITQAQLVGGVSTGVASILSSSGTNIQIHHNKCYGGYILHDTQGTYGQCDFNIIDHPSGDTGYSATNPNFFIGGTLIGNIATYSADNGFSLTRSFDIAVQGNTGKFNNTSGLALATACGRNRVIGNSFGNNGSQAVFATSAKSRAGINLYATCAGDNHIIGNNLFDDQGGGLTQQYGLSNETTAGQTISSNSYGAAGVSARFLAGTTQDLILDEQGITILTAYAPTVTSGTGVITTVTDNGSQYSRRGQTVTCDFDFTITTVGTGAGTLNVSLPFTVVNAVDVNGTGRQDNTGNMVQVRAQSGTNNAVVFRYDNASVVSAASHIKMSVTFQTTAPLS